MVYSPGEDRRTVIRTGTGLFYARVPLLAADFLDNPERVVTLYGESGSLISPPVVFQNAYVAQLPSSRFIQTVRNLDTSPRNFTCNFEVGRELRRGMVVRTSYLYSQTRSLYVVTPLMGGPGRASLLGLSSTGGSHYHELEAILHYQPGERTELNVSYTHSRVRGDLNTLAEVFVPFERPVIRPNVTSNLAADVPNRVVGRAALPLPRNWTLSPVVDVHSDCLTRRLIPSRTT